MVLLFAGGRGVQVFVCSVQTFMGNPMGVFGLVMGGVMRDYLRFCFGGRTGVRGVGGGWGRTGVWGTGVRVGLRRGLWRVLWLFFGVFFPIFFGGSVAFHHRQVLGEGV